MAENANDRNEYKQFMTYLKRVSKYKGGDTVAKNIADFWKVQYKRKSAMILALAGPNGSGKSTITTFFDKICKYTNANDIVAATGMDNMEATNLVDKLRYESIGKEE